MSTPINFDSTTPAAPPDNVNVTWQTDADGNLSAYIVDPSGVYLPLAGGTLSGNLTLDGTVTDGSASVGSSGQVLSSTVTGVKWVAQSGGGATSGSPLSSGTGTAGSLQYDGTYLYPCLAETVGRFRFRKPAQCVIKRDFHGIVGAKSVGTSGYHTKFVVEALDGTVGYLSSGAKPIQQ
jgi:hypothetical protein